MFAPPVAKPKTKPAARPKHKSALERSTLPRQRFGDAAVEPGLHHRGIAHSVPPSASQALDAARRAYFEPRFASGALSGSSPLGTWARSLLRAPQTIPGDAAERSADRAADTALGDQHPAQQIRATTATPDVGTPPWGAGRRLTREERQWHEPRIGAAFGEVRVHEGAAPGRWARLLGARAFTIGRDIVLGRGEYARGTDAGRHLLAHELAHVAAARSRAPVLARVALTAADFEALADALHDAIATASADSELIYVALQKLERDTTAIGSLKAAYLKKYQTDLLTALGARLKGDSLGLARTLLAAKGGLKVATTPPSAPADYAAAARALHTAFAAKTVDAERVYAVLLPLARDPSRTGALKTAYTTMFTTDLEAGLTAHLTGAELSYALYLLNAPGPAGAHQPSIFTAQPGFGTAPATAPPAAAGGTVSAGTQVPYQTKTGKTGTYGFGVGYSGALSADTRWLQFIEREIDYTPKGGGKPIALDREISSGGGKNKYRLTTVSKSPNWSVDSFDPSDPFFDETHSSDAWRDAASVSIYDAPAARDDLVKEMFDNGATAVTSRAHFEIYLIRDFSAIYHVEIEIIWTYSAPGKRATNRVVKTTGAVGGLPSALKAALVARYPAHAYIR